MSQTRARKKGQKWSISEIVAVHGLIATRSSRLCLRSTIEPFCGVFETRWCAMCAPDNAKPNFRHFLDKLLRKGSLDDRSCHAPCQPTGSLGPCVQSAARCQERMPREGGRRARWKMGAMRNRNFGGGVLLGLVRGRSGSEASMRRPAATERG